MTDQREANVLANSDVSPQSPSATPGDLELGGFFTRLANWAWRGRVLLVAFGASRLLLVLATYVASWLGNVKEGSNLLRRPLFVLSSWDAAHYRHIAEFGYSTSHEVVFGTPEIDRVVFFPMWPIVERLGDTLSPSIGLLGTSLILANLIALAAMFRLRALLVRETGSNEIAERAAVYFAIFPSAYVLSMGYGDALFMLLTVVFWDFVRRRRWLLAAGIGVLAGLTRWQGALLAIPAFIEFITLLRERNVIGGAVRKAKGLLPAALAVISPAVGISLFFGFIYMLSGDFFLSVKRMAQPQWKGEPGFFLLEAAKKIREGVTVGVFQEAVLAVGVLLAFGLVIYGFRRLPFALSAYVLAGFVLGTASTRFGSTDRYMMLLFPMFWILAHLGNRKSFDVIYRTLSPGLLALLTVAVSMTRWIP